MILSWTSNQSETRKVLCRQQYTSSRMYCTRLNQQASAECWGRRNKVSYSKQRRKSSRLESDRRRQSPGPGGPATTVSLSPSMPTLTLLGPSFFASWSDDNRPEASVLQKPVPQESTTSGGLAKQLPSTITSTSTSQTSTTSTTTTLSALLYNGES